MRAGGAGNAIALRWAPAAAYRLRPFQEGMVCFKEGARWLRSFATDDRRSKPCWASRPKRTHQTRARHHRVLRPFRWWGNEKARRQARDGLLLADWKADSRRLARIGGPRAATRCTTVVREPSGMLARCCSSVCWGSSSIWQSPARTLPAPLARSLRRGRPLDRQQRWDAISVRRLAATNWLATNRSRGSFHRVGGELTEHRVEIHECLVHHDFPAPIWTGDTVGSPP